MNAINNITSDAMMKGSKHFKGNEGLDDAIAAALNGKAPAQYKADRLSQRVEQVQAEADHRVTRLHSLVELDAAQKDQVFALMARSSLAFVPSMHFEGLSGDTTPLPAGQSRNDALRSVLRPDQWQKYEESRQQRRLAAEKDLREIGLRLPPNWDALNED